MFKPSPAIALGMSIAVGGTAVLASFVNTCHSALGGECQAAVMKKGTSVSSSGIMATVFAEDTTLGREIVFQDIRRPFSGHVDST